MSTLETQIRQRYHHVLERIVQVVQSAGRKPDDVKLIVVTKAHPVEVAQAAIAAGACTLGENYAEEAVSKMQGLYGYGIGHSVVEWHMIGHVQSRKARLIVKHFDLIHSLDRVKLARRLNRFAVESDRTLPALLQVNVSGEETKFGFAAWEEEHWPQLCDPVNQILDLPGLELRGLMTIPPFVLDPEITRPYFRRLRRLRDYLARQFLQTGWDELSMGMSADYEVAIQEGATLVRVGQAILGPRPRRSAR